MMTTDSQNTKQDPNETTTTNKRLEQHLPIATPPPPPPPHPVRPRAKMMLCNVCFFRFEGIFKAFSYKVY